MNMEKGPVIYQFKCVSCGWDANLPAPTPCPQCKGKMVTLISWYEQKADREAAAPVLPEVDEDEERGEESSEEEGLSSSG